MESHPFFTGPGAIEHAISYAWEATEHRPREIRLLARDGATLMLMPLDKAVQPKAPAAKSASMSS